MFTQKQTPSDSVLAHESNQKGVWNVAVAESGGATLFQEVREHLGFETTRQRVANSVLRTAPCLLGHYGGLSDSVETSPK